MISRFGNKNFLAAHYDWLVLAVGVVVLAVGAAIYVSSLGEDAEEAAADEVRRIRNLKPGETGVKPLDMTGMRMTLRHAKEPVRVSDVSAESESFLASERRVLCVKCRKAIPGDVKLCPACPFCGEPQKVEAKVVLDSDADGLPDEWEKKHGLNPNNAADAQEDADGDDFTNLEEYAAKTDPRDRNDHPDYLDSLTIQLPLKKTYMPFVFTAAYKIPAGWRCEFFDPKQRDNYGRLGRTVTALIGEEIGKSGYVLKGCEQKSAAVAIKGGKNMTRTEDRTEVKVERKSDGKVLSLVVAKKNSRPASVDVQATLSYSRGNGKTMDVIKGDELTLSGTKYKVCEILSAGKSVKVTLENVPTGKKRTLVALEQ